MSTSSRKCENTASAHHAATTPPRRRNSAPNNAAHTIDMANAFVGACLAYYIVRAKGLQTFGGRAWAVGAVVLVLHVVNSPWLSPTK